MLPAQRLLILSQAARAATFLSASLRVERIGVDRVPEELGIRSEGRSLRQECCKSTPGFEANYRLTLRRDRQPSSLTRGKRAGLAVAAQLSSLPFSVAGTEWVGQSNEQAGETPGRQSPPPRTRQLVPAPSIYPLLLHALHDPLWPSSSPHSPRGTYHKSCII